jgi:DNA-binding MarR family transcriptional regulator
MTAVLLIYRREATTTADIASALRKTEPSAKALLRSLSTGSSKDRTGYEFVTKARDYDSTTKRSRNKYYLTPNGKEFARLIAPFFEG